MADSAFSFPFNDFVRTAQTGCTLCSLIYEAYAGFATLGSASDDIFGKVTIWPGSLDRPLDIAYPRTSTSSPIRLEFFVPEGFEIPIPELGRATEVAPDASMEACSEFLIDSIKTCDEVHVTCRPSTPSTLPTRVIDLGPSAGEILPKLYHSRGEKAPYIALSHCWGSNQSFKTEKATLSERCAGININELPKTFRDAIMITKKLRIRYLWIDSLCIIQDDRQDWEIESASMADIYAGSYLTIVALLSSGDESGFLGPRSTTLAKTFNLKLAKSSTPVRVREKIWNAGLDWFKANPLLSRAWAYQELLISPRIAAYTAAELQWYCAEVNTCECDRLRLQSSTYSHLSLDLRRSVIRTDSRDKISWFTGAHRIQYERWYALVGQYSGLSLTVPSDKLPALSALARLFYQERLQDNYLAGLWRKDILQGMMWQVRLYRPFHATLPTTYRAPSWSWASIDGDIFWDRDVTDFSFKTPNIPKVLEASCDTAGSNLLGEVSAGYIELEGHVKSALLEVPDVEDGYIEHPHTFLACNLCLGLKVKDRIEVLVFPDTLLTTCQHSSEEGVVEQTARRSCHKPGQRRPSFSARVWILTLHAKLAMVLVRSKSVPGAYERIALMKYGKGYDARLILGELTRIKIV